MAEPATKRLSETLYTFTIGKSHISDSLRKPVRNRSFPDTNPRDPYAAENPLGMIADHSPMSWAHINMLGEYDVSDENSATPLESPH